MPVMVTATMAAALTAMRRSTIMVAVVLTVMCRLAIMAAALTVTPVTIADITAHMDMHLCEAMATAVMAAAALTGTRRFAATGAAVLTDTQCTVVLTMAVMATPCTIVHITELTDTRGTSRGIGFIDRFTLSQDTCRAFAPSFMEQHIGVDVRVRSSRVVLKV
jgi:hypothetical protein